MHRFGGQSTNFSIDLHLLPPLRQSVFLPAADAEFLGVLLSVPFVLHRGA